MKENGNNSESSNKRKRETLDSPENNDTNEVIAPKKRRRVEGNSSPSGQDLKDDPNDYKDDVLDQLDKEDSDHSLSPQPRRSSRSKKKRFENIDLNEDDLVLNDDYSDPEKEAESAVRAGFLPHKMMEFEAVFFTKHKSTHQSRYVVLRNLILHKWKRNVKEFLSLQELKKSIKKQFHEEVSSIWEFLTRLGYINSGFFAKIPDEKRMVPLNKKRKIIIIGAGASGLASAQQLYQFGYDVTILEANNRIGGRVRSEQFGNQTIDLGASIVTGLIGNPLDNIFHQSNARGFVTGDNAIIKSNEAKNVDDIVDANMNNLFNKLLSHVSKLKNTDENDRSLGEEMEKYHPDLTSSEKSMLYWYYANLEYACATDLKCLSLNHWDQDDPYDFSGEHMIMTDGYISILEGIAKGVDIQLNKIVTSVQYNEKGVEVETSNGEKYIGDICLITISLGVLKQNKIKFSPPLPNYKINSIKKLGYGLLNKVLLLFDDAFWEKDVDWIGRVSVKDTVYSNRGKYYLFWNYYKIHKKPILLALVTGEAAHEQESKSEEEILKEILSYLREMYNLDYTPKILNHNITRWKSDPNFYGSYSFVAKNSSGEDYESLAKPIIVNDRPVICFGGEHTNRMHPATVAGAYESGLREAERIHSYFYPQQKLEIELPPSDSDEAFEKRNKIAKKQKIKKDKKKRYRERGVLKKLGSGNKKYQFKYEFQFSDQTVKVNSSPKYHSYGFGFTKPRRDYNKNFNSTYNNNYNNNYNSSYDNNRSHDDDIYNTNTSHDNVTYTNYDKYSSNSQSSNTNNTTNNLLEQVDVIINTLSNITNSAEKEFKKTISLAQLAEKIDENIVSDEKRRTFRDSVAEVIVNRLSRHHKKKRITNKDDFKHLSRKFTHKIIEHEKKHKADFVFTVEKKKKVKKMIDTFFKKHKVYVRK